MPPIIFSVQYRVLVNLLHAILSLRVKLKFGQPIVWQLGLQVSDNCEFERQLVQKSIYSRKFTTCKPRTTKLV